MNGAGHGIPSGIFLDGIIVGSKVILLASAEPLSTAEVGVGVKLGIPSQSAH